MESKAAMCVGLATDYERFRKNNINTYLREIISKICPSYQLLISNANHRAVKQIKCFHFWCI